MSGRGRALGGFARQNAIALIALFVALGGGAYAAAGGGGFLSRTGTINGCVASKGGADHHPAWYHNIQGSKEISFQVATQAFRGGWREPRGAERAKVWDFMVGVFPPYRNYQSSTSREIPLVMLSADEPIEIFTE